jgi:hypothetical protein
MVSGRARFATREVMDVENEENIPPQNRRSERVKGRKNASSQDIGELRVTTTLTLVDEDMDGSDVERDDEDHDEEEDEDEDDDTPRKRTKKTPPPKAKHRAAAKTNGVSKVKKQRKARKSDTVEVPENTTECPMLGSFTPRRLTVRGVTGRQNSLGRHCPGMDRQIRRK